jgi:hypothetical protein
MNTKLQIYCFLGGLLFFLSFPHFMWAGQVDLVPSLETRITYDDNIDYNQSDEIDDFSVDIIPKLELQYLTENLKLSTNGKAEIQRYFTETDFDTENYLVGVDSEYRMSERWNFLGNFEFREDETIDSQLEETGQVFDRDTRTRYDAETGLRYRISELTTAGPNFFYRRTDFDSKDNVDWDLYTISFPVSKNFKNQVDRMTIEPAYSRFDSDKEEGDDYRLSLDWHHEYSKTFRSKIYVGGRYTKTDEKNVDEDDTLLDWFARLDFTQFGETYRSDFSFLKELRGNTTGNIIEVYRIRARLDKRFKERFGMKFSGSLYYSDTVSDNVAGDLIRFFELIPSLYFLITPDHSINLTYTYQNQKEFDNPGNPETQRNMVWLGLILKFPKSWQ